ncbi:MAG: LysR family transcriptional regulator [Myxococcales bacterium]|nr:MAG: LysR family transcriptional regulator [Myxococcales bacterium]
MDPLESRSLRYFVAVARELNFARAAERLRIAPPALSRAIAALEDQLGVRLLERTTRRVELTAAGRALLDQGQLALDALDAAARCARRAADPQRRIVLALKAEFDGGLLEPILAHHRQRPDAAPPEVRVGRGQVVRVEVGAAHRVASGER